MTDTPDFDDFVRARSTHLLRLAYLLTRDHAAAEDLVQTALARSWSAWWRIEGNPEPYVRRVMVNAYASWRGRRWHAERPSSALPEVPQPDEHAAVDARDEIDRALARLPRQQRAVLVLRYLEDMSEAQISEVLGISSGTVKSYAARGLAALRTDTSLAVLEPPAGDVPAGLERLAGVHERIRRDRRRRIGAVVVAGLVVLALLLGYVLSPLVRANSLPTVGPRVGSTVHGYRIVSVLRAPLSAGSESMTFTPTTNGAALFPVCAYTGNIRRAMVDVEINGRGREGDSAFCSRDGHVSTWWQPQWPASVPVRLTIRLGPIFGGQLPTRGTMALAVGEPIPPRLPPRPSRLVPLHRTDQVILDAAHPSTTLSANGVYNLLACSQTPGMLLVSAANLAWTIKIPDWNADPNWQFYNPVLGQGPVTISVLTQYVTGDWYVAVGGADRTC